MESSKGKIYYGVGLDNSELKSDAVQAQNILRGVGTTAVNEGSKMDKAFKQIGVTIATVFSVQQAKEFVTQIVKTRGEIQSLSIAFETMLGSKEKADKMMNDAVKMSLKTPFTLTDIATNVKQLIAMGISSDKAVDSLKSLGNVAAGLSVPISRLAINYGQVSALGKLQAREVKDFAMAGVPIIKVLGENLNKTETEISDMISAGKIGFPEVEEAFHKMGSAGGQFANLMEKMNMTVTGQISNLKDKIILMMNDMGEENEGLIYGVIGGSAKIVQHYKEVGEVIGALIATYGVYKATIIATNAVKASTIAITHTEEAKQLFTLLTVEQQELITKQGLSVASAEYYTAVKESTKQNVLEAESELIKARASVSASAKITATRRAEYVASKAIVEQRKLELIEITKTGTAKQIEIAQNKVALASTEMNTTAIAFQSSSRDFSAKKIAVESASKGVNSLSTNVNTASQTANVTVTGLLGVAKLKLASITAKLNALIMANPYAIATASVALLAYGIYKLVTYEDDAEKAQKALNKSFEESEISIASEVHQVQAMFHRLKEATKGTEEYKTAKDALFAKYGDQLKQLGDEKTALNDVAKAYDLIIKSVKETARAKALAKYTEESSDTFATQEAEKLAKIRKELDKRFGDQYNEETGKKRATEYFQGIKDYIQGGEMTDATKGIIASFEEITGGLITNKIGDVVDEALKASEAYEQNMRDAEELFGAKRTEATTATPEAKAEVETLSDADQKALEKRKKSIQDYYKEVATQEELNALDLEKKRIALMKDGFAKEMAENELQYKESILENKARQAKMVDELKDVKGAEFLNSGKKGKFDPNSVTSSDLSTAQQTQIKAYNEYAQQQKIKSNQDTLAKLLDQYTSYQQQRQDIQDKYESEKGVIVNDDGTLKEGITQQNIDELNKKEEDALLKVDEQLASREGSYKTWLSAIKSMTLSELNTVLDEAKTALEQAQAEAPSSENSIKLATARAKIAETKKAIKTASDSTDESPNKKSISDWHDLNEELRSASDEFEKVGDAIGGAFGEIMKTTGTILTSSVSMINGIVQLATASSTAMTATATTASVAIATVEKASLVLAVISSALQIATAIADAFNSTDYMDEFIASMKEVNYQLELAVLNAKIGNDDRDTIFGNDAWASMRDNVNASIEALERSNKAEAEMVESRNKYLRSMEEFYLLESGSLGEYKSYLEVIEDMTMQIQHSTWFRDEKRQSLKDAGIDLEDENGELDLAKLEAFMNSDAYKKLSQADKDRIDEIYDFKEAYTEAMDEVKDYFSDIFGDLGTEISDIFLESAQTGKDAWEDVGDSISDMLSDLAQQMIYSLTLAPLMQQMQDDMLTIQTTITDPGEQAKAIAELFDNLMGDLPDAKDKYDEYWNMFEDKATKAGFDISGDSERTASSSGIATASQDSVDENNGRLTMIQSHTYMINLNVNLLVVNTSMILNHLAGIHDNTNNLSRLENIENSISTLSSGFSELKDRGIKIRN